ncbi:MAG: amino acid ABC transporter substrate-binding protein [Flavobacteriales bacterium]|nr:amino acid ABC transporter substrate-binding protein [Flavobacteriales bacterium]
MMSVQNLRRRLSGNKIIVIGLCLVLLSCNAFRLVPETKGGNTEPVKNNPTDQTETTETTKEAPSESGEMNEKPEKESNRLKTIEFFGEKYQVAPHKDQFRIALILPFFYDAQSDIEKRTSEVMLDYYMGVRMALTELEASGFKVKFWVYDNKNDTNELKRILKKRELQSMDIIIGPIQAAHMAIVSEFGRDQKIPVFSPFTSMGDLPSNNSRFYSPSPNMEARANRVVDFMKKNYPKQKLVIIRDGSSYEKRIVPELLNALKADGSISYKVENYDRKLLWANLLSSTDTTIVYIPTNQSVVVNSSLGKIFSTKRGVVVLGEDAWADFEDNDYNFWLSLNVHLVATDFINYDDPAVATFRRTFRDTFVMDPSTYAYTGYDQMRFIGDFLMAFGEHFPAYINGHDFRYLGANYHFEERSGCNQNTHVFILRFRDQKLIPVE